MAPGPDIFEPQIQKDIKSDDSQAPKQLQPIEGPSAIASASLVNNVAPPLPLEPEDLATTADEELVTSSTSPESIPSPKEAAAGAPIVMQKQVEGDAPAVENVEKSHLAPVDPVVEKPSVVEDSDVAKPLEHDTGSDVVDEERERVQKELYE